MFPFAIGVFAIAYFLAVRFGLTFRFQSSPIAVLWPATALLLAGLILAPRRQWWIVLATGATAHALASGPSVPAWRLVWQIAGNLAFVTATAEALRRSVGFPIHFGTPREVVVFVAASCLAPLLFALTAPAFVLTVLGLERTYSPGDVLLRGSLSISTAMLLIAPVVLLWTHYAVDGRREVPARRLLECAALVASLLAVGLAAFGTGPGVANLPVMLTWIFPPLLWAAIRFGPLGASTSLFCVAALSLWGTSRQLGPFVLAAQADQVLSLQLFWIVLCPPVMLLAAVIRERERAEQALESQRNQLAHVMRVATIGEMSGILAHELNQPLTAISFNAEAAMKLLSKRPEDVGEALEIIADISREHRQAAGMIARQRAFLKDQSAPFEAVSIEAIVRDALTLGHSKLKTCAIDVHTQIAPDLPPVQGDAVQLLQVVLNLVVNACDSMGSLPASERRLCVKAVQVDAQHIEVSVADRGAGLPRGLEERVFEPFFTTKSNGLGLGLAICRTITLAHRGRLWGENNPDGGATFYLSLPGQGHPGAARSGAEHALQSKAL